MCFRPAAVSADKKCPECRALPGSPALLRHQGHLERQKRQERTRGTARLRIEQGDRCRTGCNASLGFQHIVVGSRKTGRKEGE